MTFHRSTDRLFSYYLRSMPKNFLSFVIPVFNEEENIPLLLEELQRTLLPLSEQYEYELIFIDDGSKDHSWKVIQNLAQSNERIRAAAFSRNFGHQAAITAGYQLARGDAIITMDADMQDPPSLILKMLQKWEMGAKIVYARRADRKDNFLKQFTAKLYYRFLDLISDVKIPRNVGDFRLIDRQVLDVLLTFKEKARYFRGMVAWTGFRHDFVDFVRPNRTNGTTGYTWPKMFKLAFDGMTSFSLFPLKIAAFAGLFVIPTGLAMFAYITFDTLLNGVNYPLFKWLTTVLYIFMGVQFVLIWLLGEYIGRIHEQQKERPLFIIAEKLQSRAPEEKSSSLKEKATV